MAASRSGRGRARSRFRAGWLPSGCKRAPFPFALPLPCVPCRAVPCVPCCAVRVCPSLSRLCYRYAYNFETNDIDGPALCELTQDQLREDLMVCKLGHLLKIMADRDIFRNAMMRGSNSKVGRKGNRGVADDDVEMTPRKSIHAVGIDHTSKSGVDMDSSDAKPARPCGRICARGVAITAQPQSRFQDGFFSGAFLSALVALLMPMLLRHIGVS